MPWRVEARGEWRGEPGAFGSSPRLVVLINPHGYQWAVRGVWSDEQEVEAIDELTKKAERFNSLLTK